MNEKILTHAGPDSFKHLKTWEKSDKLKIPVQVEGSFQGRIQDPLYRTRRQPSRGPAYDFAKFPKNYMKFRKFWVGGGGGRWPSCHLALQSILETAKIAAMALTRNKKMTRHSIRMCITSHHSEIFCYLILYYLLK